MKFKPTYLILAVVLLLAVALRFYDLGKIPVSLYWDEVAILVDAKTIATNGKDMHGNPWFQTMFPSYGDYKLPVYIWFAALSVKLLGVSEFAVRLPSALAGVGTVILSGAIFYRLTELFKKGTVLEKTPNLWAMVIGCLLMAISPWSILFSRTGFEGHLAQFFVSLSLFVLLYANKRKWLLLASVLLGSLATYTYFSVRFVWPVIFVAGYLLHFSRFGSPIKKIPPLFFNIAMMMVSLGIYFLSLQPMLTSTYYQASNQFRLSTTSILNSYDYPLQANILRQQAGNSFIDRIIFHRHWLLVRELGKNYADNLDFAFLFLTGDPNLRHGTGYHGLLLFPMLFLLVWGIYLLGKEKPQLLAFLAVWWLIALLPASVPESTPHALRSLNALMPVILISSFGFLDMIVSVSKKPKDLMKLLVVSGLVAALTASSFSFNYYYFKIYPTNSAFDWQDGYKQLALKISQREDSVDTVWVSSFDDRFYLWLLAFGSYDAQTIQNLPKQDYKITELDNIIFEGFDWSKSDQLENKALMIERQAAIEEIVTTSPKQPDDLSPIVGYDKQVRFIMASYEN